MDGDEKSAAIAAASIVAKVARDRRCGGWTRSSRSTASRRTSATSRPGTPRSCAPTGRPTIHRRSFQALCYADRRSRRQRTPAERPSAARWHYRLRGYRILGTQRLGGRQRDRPRRSGAAGRLVFCEVKSKGGEGYGDPLEMVGAGEAPPAPARRREPGSRRSPSSTGSRRASKSSPSAAGRLERVDVASPTDPSARSSLPRGTIPERTRSSERLRPGASAFEAGETFGCS